MRMNGLKPFDRAKNNQTPTSPGLSGKELLHATTVDKNLDLTNDSNCTFQRKQTGVVYLNEGDGGRFNAVYSCQERRRAKGTEWGDWMPCIISRKMNLSRDKTKLSIAPNGTLILSPSEIEKHVKVFAYMLGEDKTREIMQEVTHMFNN